MSHAEAPIRIVIADDHEIFRDGFRLLLKKQPELQLVGEAENGRHLLEVVNQVRPDIAFVDIKMPEMDGVEACRQLKKRHPRTRVIALSMFNDDHLVVDMFEAGARGYLLKNTNRKEILEAAQAVHEGQTYYCEATSEKLTRALAISGPRSREKLPQFTEREKQIIRLICRQWTTREIATELNLSMRTIESYREKIQEKTESKNTVGVVIFAIKHKLVEV